MYLALRNRRSHEQLRDTQNDADAIILFIDFVIRILDASEEAFTVEQFLNNISDPEFVETKRYAELLTSEIPVNRRGDAILALLRIRTNVDVRKLVHLVATLISLLNESQLAQFISVISDELRVATEDAQIRTALQMLPAEMWPRITETARLRIENKMKKEIASGQIVGGRAVGALGTWSGRFIKNFNTRAEVVAVLNSKLEDRDGDIRHYVAKYFLPRFPEMMTEESEVRRATRAISLAIEKNDENVREVIIANVRQFPANWQSQLVEGLKKMTDSSNPAVVLDDGTPLLAAPTEMEVSDDDIPF